MNEIKAQDTRSQASTPLSSAPQAAQDTSSDVSPQQKVQAVSEAEKAASNVGKQLPQEAPLTAEEKSSEVEEAVSKLNEYVQKTQRNLDFSLDEDSGKTVIRVYDRQSEQLVRQIPDEVALELAKKLNTEEPALLFSAQV